MDHIKVHVPDELFAKVALTQDKSILESAEQKVIVTDNEIIVFLLDVSEESDSGAVYKVKQMNTMIFNLMNFEFLQKEGQKELAFDLKPYNKDIKAADQAEALRVECSTLEQF